MSFISRFILTHLEPETLFFYRDIALCVLVKDRHLHLGWRAVGSWN